MEAVKDYTTPNKPPREWTEAEKEEAAQYLAATKTVRELRKRVSAIGDSRGAAYECGCPKSRAHTLANLAVMEFVDLFAISIIQSQRSAPENE